MVLRRSIFWVRCPPDPFPSFRCLRLGFLRRLFGPAVSMKPTFQVELLADLKTDSPGRSDLPVSSMSPFASEHLAFESWGTDGRVWESAANPIREVPLGEGLDTSYSFARN